MKNKQMFVIGIITAVAVTILVGCGSNTTAVVPVTREEEAIPEVTPTEELILELAGDLKRWENQQEKVIMNLDDTRYFLWDKGVQIEVMKAFPNTINNMEFCDSICGEGMCCPIGTSYCSVSASGRNICVMNGSF